MHEPGARRVFHKRVSRQEPARALAEGVLVLKLAQVIGLQAPHDLVALPAALLGHRREERRRHDELLFPDLNQRIAECGVVGDGEVRRQRPRSRGPNHHRNPRPPHDGKLHIDALADVVFVLDFGLGQGGSTGNAPIDRLLAAVHKPLLDEVRHKAQLLGLVCLIERQVGMLPVSEHAQPLELRALDADVLPRISLAGGADGGGS